MLSVNCNSLRSLDKRSQLISLIDQHTPSVILGQESKLCPDFKSSEIFPDNYTTCRKDRSEGGGGVFVLVRDDIISSDAPFADLETNFHQHRAKCFYKLHPNI